MNAQYPMLVPPVIITSFKDVGTLPPKIYSKCVFVVPFNVLPTNGNVIDSICSIF